jgi:hypothetical protein
MTRVRPLASIAWIAGIVFPALSQGQTHQQGTASRPTLTPALVATRAALDKYQDPIVAVHDGYFSTLGCIEYSSGSGPGHGAMAY